MRRQETIAAPGTPVDRSAGRGLRVAFVGSKCLLDDASGIAHSIRSILEALARSGAEATSFSAALFDMNGDVALDDRIGHQGERVEDDGNGIVRVLRSGVQHFVMRTASSRKFALSGSESRRMHRTCKAFLAAKGPDIVITYGTGSHAMRLHAAIRAAGAQVVFYLGNAESVGSGWFHSGDRAVCPSRFLANLYAARIPGPVDVLHPIITADRFVHGGKLDALGTAPPEAFGFVTHINPIPQKGLTLLIELARRAAQERPKMKFLVLEGLMTGQALRRASVDVTSFPNIRLLPVQRDMAAVYAQTAILLMPSYWREGFGRAAVEAHLSGVPVLASAQGGLPEALGGAGTLLDIPSDCMSNPLLFPDEATIARWWAALTSLWDNPAVYAAAARHAFQAGQRYHPAKTTRAVVEFFRRVAAARPPSRLAV